MVCLLVFELTLITRCHETENICPGKAVAKNCVSDRVLLSTHMMEHWKNIGYSPDTSDLNEVDELDIQIGKKVPEPPPADLLRPDHTSKYSSLKSYHTAPLSEFEIPAKHTLGISHKLARSHP